MINIYQCKLILINQNFSLILKEYVNDKKVYRLNYFGYNFRYSLVFSWALTTVEEGENETERLKQQTEMKSS